MPGKRSKLLLLTDGEPSVGPEQLPAFVRQGTVVAERGVSVHALGLARHYIADILTALTLPSGNGFEHVDGPEGLAEAFGAMCARLFGEVAHAATVSATPQGFSSLRCEHAYPTQSQDGALTAVLGDVSNAVPRRVLFSGSVALAPWSLALAASWKAKGEPAQTTVPVDVVSAESARGRLVLATRHELALVAHETNAWAALGRREKPKALAELHEAEAALRALVLLRVDGIPVNRHLERINDLSAAVERGEGDLPLLARRALSAKARADTSQFIFFNGHVWRGR